MGHTTTIKKFPLKPFAAVKKLMKVLKPVSIAEIKHPGPVSILFQRAVKKHIFQHTTSHQDAWENKDAWAGCIGKRIIYIYML